MHVSVWSVDEMASHASLFATWLLEIGHRGVFAHVVSPFNILHEALPQLNLPSRMHTTGSVLLVYESKALKDSFLHFGSR